MKISAKMDYACRALLELSLHWPNKEPVCISSIGAHQKIPHQFLNHILIHLKQLGYTESIRGKKGGYLLACSPRDINLGDVIADLGSVGYSITDDRSSDNHVLNDIWTELDHVVMKAMKKFNFEDILNRHRKEEEALIFNI